VEPGKSGIKTAWQFSIARSTTDKEWRKMSCPGLLIPSMMISSEALAHLARGGQSEVGIMNIIDD
jgi:hypothetical protein